MPSSPPPIASVAVLGCGLIGESWSALFLAHGLDVVAWDPDGGTLAALPKRVEPLLGQLRAFGPTAARPGRLSIAPSVATAVVGAAWIQENAPEKTAVKHGLYAEVEAAAAPDAVIASSTSSLTWTDLAAGVVRRDRFITAHPFNPPHLMPLVELFAADAQTLGRAEAFYRSLGRVTVALKKDAVGHIANRLASALWREAVNIVAEGNRALELPVVRRVVTIGPASDDFVRPQWKFANLDAIRRGWLEVLPWRAASSRLWGRRIEGPGCTTSKGRLVWRCLERRPWDGFIQELDERLPPLPIWGRSTRTR